MPRNFKRTSTRGSWTEDILKDALKAIDNGTSINAASKLFKIPFSTLQERRKKGLQSKPTLGRHSTFTQEQEEALAARITLLSNVFYGLTPLEVRRVAYEFAEKNKIPHRFPANERLAGRDWLYAFLKRNPSIATRKPEATSINRATAFSRENVKLFFNNLENVLDKTQYTADRIYNADETGITTVQEPGTILATKGKKRVGSVTSWERGKLVTVMCAMSAAGNYVPPMFIYPRKRMSPLLKKDGPPCAIYECSPKGWTNESLFVTWLKHFIQHTKSTADNPTLLILDNHNSRTTLETYELCKANGVTIVSLPPHCSHRLQPLDVTFYSPLKGAFKKECDRYMKSERLLRITPYELAGLFNVAYSRVATVGVAVSGFKTTGIHPFNPNIFSDTDYCAADELIDRANLTLPVVENDELEPEPQAAASGLPSNEPSQPLNKDQLLNVSFEDLIPLPSTSSAPAKFRFREKQQSTILTATPQKKELEIAAEKKKIKELKKENAELKKRTKEMFRQLELPLPKKVKKEKGVQKKFLKQRKSKTKKKKEVSSDSDDEDDHVDEKALCNDDEFDDLPGTENENTCFICGEFGIDKEIWYRCTNCGIWVHSLCSAADSPEGFLCDLCIKI